MAKDSNSKIKHKKHYYSNGNIESEHFLLNNKLHRTDGPAIINYYNNGNISSEFYYLNGLHHRIDGPAIIFYFENGNIELKYYYLNNKQIYVNSDKDFIKWQKIQILK